MVLDLFVCVGTDLVEEVYLSEYCECVCVYLKSGQGIGLFLKWQNKFRVIILKPSLREGFV